MNIQYNQYPCNMLMWWSVAVLSTLLLSCGAQHYANVNIDNLEELFSEENCIEGTFTYSNKGNINTIQFTGLSTLEHVKDEWQGLSPLQLVNELAFLNNIDYLYDLIDEEGPPHKKNFIVTLQLGKEKYRAEGASIKKAKVEAAKLALNSTLYIQPPKRPVNLEQSSGSRTAVQQLDNWVNKHSGVELSYTYTNQPDHEEPHHKTDKREANIYSKSQNVFEVVVKVSDLVEKKGEGVSAQAAKEDAAQKALSELRQAGAYCMLGDNSFFGFQSNQDSPVSLVHQFGSNLGAEVNFEMMLEEGPAHIKRFVFKLKIGDDYETLGEGSSKKAAKHAAAEAMLKHLRSVSSEKRMNCEAIIKKKSKNKKPNNFIKSVPVKPRYEFDEDSKSYDSFAKDLDPVSRLFQIQQARHETLPVFKLLDEDNKNTNEWKMEVNIGDIAFIGSGRNKKEAKRNAAEGILKKMGVVIDGDKTRLSSSDQKKEQFKEKITTASGPPDSSKESKEEKKSAYSKNKPKQPYDTNQKESKTHKKKHDHESKSDSQKSAPKAQSQLKNLAQQMGFKYQFSDFPRKGSLGSVSALSMTTNPPLICVGYGADTGVSQDRAALSALERLYKLQLQSISQVLEEQNEEEEDRPQEMIPVIPSFVTTESK